MFQRIDGKTTATSHCFETFVSMVIYPSTEQPIIFRDMPTPWGSAPRRVIARLRRAARLPRFPFFKREKKRLEALDPFNALLSGRSSIALAPFASTERSPNRCRRLPFQQKEGGNGWEICCAPKFHSSSLEIWPDIDSTPPRPS